MQDIIIGRYDVDPEAQGVIKPKDGRWQLVIDKDGYPHLFVQVHSEEANTPPGLMAIEDLLPKDLSVRSVMESTFGGKLSPKEEAEAIREHWEGRNIPSPR